MRRFFNVYGPAVFTVDRSQGAIQHGADYSLVTQADPARKGELVVMYGTGFWPVDPPVVEGMPAPYSPLSRTVSKASVTLGCVPAEVLFSGLTPGAFSLGQVNFRVPENAPSGNVDVVLRFESPVSPARAVKLWVE